jgi:multidrug resistance protein
MAGRRRALLTVFVTVLLDLLGFGMILPLLPFYAQDYGASEFQIGLLFASYSAAQLVCAPLLGRLSDRFGRRPLILASLFTGVVAYLAFAVAGSFAALIVARTASGVAAANLGIAQAYIADVTTPDQRAKGMGLIGAAFGLGFIGGPALGGLLGMISHVAVPLGAAALGALNLVLALIWLPESRTAGDRERARSTRWLDLAGLARLGRDRTLLGMMTLFFLVTFCFAQMEATLALFCQARFGFGQVQTSWLFVFVGVVMVAVQGGLVGRLARHFGERPLIYAGIVLMAAGLLLLPTAPGLGVLLVASGLMALGNGLFNPSYLGLLSRLAADDSQGGTLGLSRSFSALARVLGPPVGTWVFGHFGAAWPFWSAGGLMAVTLGFGWLVLGAAGAPPPTS